MACEAEDAEVNIQAGMASQREVEMENAIALYNFRIQELQMAVMAAVACHEQNQRMISGSKQTEHIADCAKTLMEQTNDLVCQMRVCRTGLRQLRDALRR